MALAITGACVTFDVCKSAHPNQAITQRASIYVVDPDICTKCIGARDEQQCRAVCPADSVVGDLLRHESGSALLADYELLHS